MLPSRGRRVAPAFDPHELRALYQHGQSDALSERFLEVLHHFRQVTYPALTAQGERYVNEFVTDFLTLFTQPGYVPNRADLAEFVALNPTISNLTALSELKTTDRFLSALGSSPIESAKRLALWSARNQEKPARKAIFDADPALACAWYSAYVETYRSGLLSPVVWENLREHFAYEDERLDVRHMPTLAYFASTYVGDGLDRHVRAAINRSIRQTVAGQAAIKNRPDPQKIAVLTASWTPAHSGYRITKAFVESLRGYHLTLFPLGTRPGMDLSLFDDVRPIDFDANGVLQVGPLLENDFAVAYFPDVGLAPQSIVLTNLRIAPVQIATLGHSVSTWGALIDYFISGSRVEPAESPEGNYSERLVLLPGYGAVHERPAYTPRGRQTRTSELVVNCPWNAQKVNAPFAALLREIVRGSRRPLRFRLFASSSLARQNDYLPFVRELGAILQGAAVEVIRERPYAEYMALMEEGDFTLDAYPFGGCNTVVDSLFVSRLMVCREGDVWYNRIGPAMLRDVGLAELVATDDASFVAIAQRLIEDDTFRAALQQELDRVDLDATIFDRSEAQAFRRAVDFLVANHAELEREGARTPIRISP